MSKLIPNHTQTATTQRMSSSFDLPVWLLAAPRNPVLAVGLPLVLGSLSGFPTYNLAKEGWYYVQALSGLWKTILLMTETS